jgi:Uncharacterized protein conserved in bacteria (DUF2188)
MKLGTRDCPADDRRTAPSARRGERARTHPLRRNRRLQKRLRAAPHQETKGMETECQEPIVICVSPGLRGRWDVSEKGYDEPLATFEDKEDAYAYATDLMRSRPGSAALVEDEEGFSPLPVQADTCAADRARGPDSRAA